MNKTEQMQTSEQRYLELLKKTLSFTLWPEPPVPLDVYDVSRHWVKRLLVSLAAAFLKPWNLRLCKEMHFTEEQRSQGEVWLRYADTMIGLKRLDNLQFCIEKVIQDQVEGDFIETGVWKGGACIFMRAVLAVHKIEDRKVFVADSFEGLPEPDVEKWPQDRGDQFFKNKFLAISREEVENNFRKYGLLDEKVVFLQGYFSETLPGAPVRKLAVLRLDGDMYGSTMEALTHLYPKLSKGGFCIIDDYFLEGCRAAVEDFRKKNNIRTALIEIDNCSRYWRKEE